MHLHGIGARLERLFSTTPVPLEDLIHLEPLAPPCRRSGEPLSATAPVRRFAGTLIPGAGAKRTLR
jgi:hypothetical protein